MKSEEAQFLVKHPKWVVDEQGKIIKKLEMEQQFPMRFRLHLVGSLDQKQEFLLDVKQSEKFSIKLNFQVMDGSNWGLARLDYNSNHKNPDELSEEVPDIFFGHVGELFVRRAHLHYHVEGYPPLAWALPLEETEIKTKDVTADDLPQGFIDAFDSFVSYLNIQTKIQINPMVI